MEHIIRTEVRHTEEVVDCVTCSRCGAILDINFQIKDRLWNPSKLRKVTYYHFCSQHYDWGVESIESVESRDYCETCALAGMMDFFKMSSDTKELEVNCKLGNVRDDIAKELLEQYESKLNHVKPIDAGEFLGNLLPVFMTKDDAAKVRAVIDALGR